MAKEKSKTAKPRARRAAAEGKARAPKARDEAREFAIEAARLIHDSKCEDVVVLGVRELSPVTDYLVLGSGTSERQMRAVLAHAEELGKQRGRSTFGGSVDGKATWVLLDFVDVVVHLFEPQTRLHYDLEMLWGDAERVPWERPDQVNRDRAGLRGTKSTVSDGA
ncbi:MAG: ribosome silencing factor [Phycisphaerae bacterium]|nr:ribosome silencing factor [Phycisphaerae bacterium]